MSDQEKAELLEEMRKELVAHLLGVCIQYARANLRTPDGMLGVVFVQNALDSALALAEEISPRNFKNGDEGNAVQE